MSRPRRRARGFRLPAETQARLAGLDPQRKGADVWLVVGSSAGPLSPMLFTLRAVRRAAGRAVARHGRGAVELRIHELL